MKAFVTGGSGFLGSHLVRQLVARGDEVHALARSGTSAARLADMGARVVPGDIIDVDSMRDAMRGSDVVFHVAGWYNLGGDDVYQAETINVGGTRKVLTLAHELGVPRIVYTSTVAVFGDTGGRLVDEAYRHDGPWLTEYDRTKWLAHYEVALPLIQKGAPIIIVMPGVIYGPGDHGLIGQLMRTFYLGQLPVIPGPSTTYTFVHVKDSAAGHILAAEKGQPGESYVMTGPAVPLGELIDFWSYLTGRRRPVLALPAGVMPTLAGVSRLAGSVLPVPTLYSADALTVSSGVTYMARSDKARAQLGWDPRPLQAGMQETFDWIAANYPEPEGPGMTQKQQIGLGLLLAALVLFLLWRQGRRRG